MSIKSEQEGVLKQSFESQEIDRVIKEAYDLMYERQKLAKGKPEELDEDPGSIPHYDLLKKTELEEKITKLRGLGMREGELSKLTASLEDPLLTNF